MEYTAKWGAKGFLISPTKIVPLTGLKTSVAVKSEAQNDTSGEDKTNVIGRELQTVSFSTTYMSAAGVDPRAQLDEWCSLVGQSNPLYVGGKQFGPAMLMLKAVSTNKIEMTPTGKFLMVTVDLTFEEDANGAKTVETEEKPNNNYVWNNVNTNTGIVLTTDTVQNILKTKDPTITRINIDKSFNAAPSKKEKGGKADITYTEVYLN